MNSRDETVREIQRRIAEARGYADVHDEPCVLLQLEPGESGDYIAHTHKSSRLKGTFNGVESDVPRWPQEWCDAGVLVAEMCEPPQQRWDVRKVSDGYISQTWTVYAGADDNPFDGAGYMNPLTLHQKGGADAPEAIAPLLVCMEGYRPVGLAVKRQRYYPPLGITHEEAAQAYVEEGTFVKAAERLGCSDSNVERHVHQTTTKVRRSKNAFQHVMGKDGRLVKVRLYPDEEPADAVPPATRRGWRPKAEAPPE